MKVEDVGRFNFCPCCGRKRLPPEYDSEDDDSDHFDVEEVRCSGCERPWIACPCEPMEEIK